MNYLKIYSKLLILSLLFLSHLSVPVISSQGIFEIHVRKYLLYKSMDLAKCCPSSDTNPLNCSSKCNVYMEICLSIYQKVPHRYACDIGENMIVTDILGNDKMSDKCKKDYSIRVRERWNKNFSILVRIKHKDEINKKEESLVTLSSAEENVKPSIDWITKQLSNPKDPFELYVSFRYLCSMYHYGDKCDKYCKPSASAMGHYDCSANGDIICHDGYSGNYCDKVDCHDKCVHGRCIGPNTCRCFTGWSGRSCDQCIPYPGCVNGDCRRDEKSGDLLPLTCDCAKGWGGMFCNIDLNYCSNHLNVCLNSGECQNFGNINTNQQYRCLCKPGFRGTHCEKSVSNCVVRGCLNDGVCNIDREKNTSVCACKDSFYGDRCQFNMTSCGEFPCVGSNSRCFPDSKQGFICDCAIGFIGRNCEIDKDECSTNPCLNGGMCIDRASGFRCVCPVGFSGDRCQVNKNDCQRLSCMNGAKCMDRANSIECECNAGWTGPLCDHNINECASNQPCMNGGECEDSPGAYRCICPRSWQGEHCQVRAPHNTTIDRKCLVNPCGNNGVCFLASEIRDSDPVSKEIGGSYYCVCPPGFAGRLCKQVIINNRSMDHVISTPSQSFAKRNNKPSMTIINFIIISIGVPAILVILIIVTFVWCKTSQKFTKSPMPTKYQNNVMKNNFSINNGNIKILNNKLTAGNSVSMKTMNNRLPQYDSLNLPLYNCARIAVDPSNLCYMDLPLNPKMHSLKSMHIDEEEDPFEPQKSMYTKEERESEKESLYKTSSPHKVPKNPNLTSSFDSNFNNQRELSTKPLIGSNSAMLNRKKGDFLGHTMCSSESSLLEAPLERNLRDIEDN